MKFKSRKSILLTIIFLCVSIMPTSFIALDFLNGKLNGELIFAAIVIIVSDILIGWIYFRTYYIITENELKYRTGPFSGVIGIINIVSIENNKSIVSYGGIKPALAGNGLLIKYNKYDELYVSPKTNKQFINKLLEINKNIKIIDYKDRK